MQLIYQSKLFDPVQTIIYITNKLSQRIHFYYILTQIGKNYTSSQCKKINNIYITYLTKKKIVWCYDTAFTTVNYIIIIVIVICNRWPETSFAISVMNCIVHSAVAAPAPRLTFQHLFYIMPLELTVTYSRFWHSHKAKMLFLDFDFLL